MAGEVGRESNRSKPLKVLNKELGDFVLLDRIGEGGMGTVFRATQKSLNRLVAVKVLSPRIAKNADFIVRFTREAKAAAALSHPNIVRAITVGEDQGFHYFVMELLEGETVGQRLRREGPLPLRDVLEIGRQTALALAHAHRKGILHRDIKPENLMLTQSTGGLTVKVMDLGLARLVREDGSITQTGMALGTPLYNSPEQARGMQNLTPACDLYSLGATLFHLATGKPPFEGAAAVEIMTKHVTEPPPDPKKLNFSLPDEFCALLLQLLAKKPEDRYESAAVLAEDLQALINAESSPASVDDGTPAGRQAGARARAAVRRRGAARRGQDAALNPLVLVGAALGLLVLVVPLLSNVSSRPVSTRNTPAPADQAAGRGARDAGSGMRPRTPDPEPRTPLPEPRSPNLEPRTPLLEPRTPLTEPRTPLAEPRTPLPEPRTPEPEPRTQEPEPRTPKPEPRTPNPEPAAVPQAVQPVVALIKRLRQSSGPRQFDISREEIKKAMSDPVYAPNVQTLKTLDAGIRSTAELYPLIEKRLAQRGRQGLSIPGSPALYLKLENGLLYYKPAPDFPGGSNKPVDTLKPADLVALSGIAEAESLGTIPAAKLAAFGAVLALLGQNKAAQRLFERGMGEGQAELAEWNDVLAALDAEERESLAAKAWADAEALFAKKQYEAAQLAYAALKTEYKGAKILTEKNAALAERLAAIETLVKPRAETEPATKPQPKTETVPAPAAKAVWKGTDLGRVGLKGSFSETAGTFTVKGSGADIGGPADAFQFVYQPLDGDGEIKARVAAIVDAHLGAKAGVMIRESPAADSKHVMAAVSVGKGAFFLRRPSIGGASARTDSEGAPPYWVRLVRYGNTFTAYVSADGVAWRLAGSDTFVMARDAYVGLAVTSDNNESLNTSTFDNVVLTRPEQTAQATAPPPPDEPTKPAPSAKTTAFPTEAAWAKAINLVPLANPAKDAIAGTWRLQAGRLFSNDHRSARLQFPYQPPEEYDARLTFSRYSGEDEVALILSKAGHLFAYVMGSKGGTLFGVQSVDGKPYGQTAVTRLPWNKPLEKHTCIVQVRNDSLKAFLDNEQVLDCKTDFKDISQANAGPWKLSYNNALGIGSSLSPTFFNSLEVLEITGKGRPIR